MVLTFKPQYPHTNSPNWSLYIFLKNKLREFDNRSRHFLLCDHFINSHNLSLDSVWILFGEIWSWSLLALKGLMVMVIQVKYMFCNKLSVKGSKSRFYVLSYHLLKPLRHLCHVIKLLFYGRRRWSIDRVCWQIPGRLY